ncbi:hypothetical protein D3C73_950980 [compost metagenome]
MIRIQHLLCLQDIQVIFGRLGPRQTQQHIDIIADHAAFSRACRHFFEPVDLFLNLFLYAFRQFLLFHQTAQLIGFAGPAFLVAKLLLDRFHLLTEIILFLRLLHLLLHPLVDLAFEFQHLTLIVEDIQQLLQTFADINRLQDLLLILDLERQMARNDVGQPARLFDIRYGGERFGSDFFGEGDVMLELVQHGAHQGIALLVHILFLRQHTRHHLVILLVVRIVNNFGPFHALHKHTDRAVGKLEHLPHIGDRADPKNIFLSRLLNIHFRLGAEENQVIFNHSFFQRPN